MKNFQSKITINRPVNEVYRFLADLNNHQQLMPEDVSNWVSTFDTASFSVKNTVKLSLKVESRIENREIKIIPAEKPPFDVVLKWTMEANGGHTNVIHTISADLNMMMKMVASGPLQKLADYETKTLGSQIMLNT